MRGGLGQDAGQHGQRLLAGRQRRQDVDVRGGKQLAFHRRRRLAFSLSLPLANSLMRRPAAPGSSVENAYSSGPISASLTTSNSVPSTARDASVFLTTFKNTPVSRAFLRIAVIWRHGDARVLGCDQGVGLRGHVCQFGDDFLLLGQIESHCTPPIELRSRLLPLAVLGRRRPWRRGRSRVPVVALPGNFQRGRHHLRRPALASGLSGPACDDDDSMPYRASCPSSLRADRTCGL